METLAELRKGLAKIEKEFSRKALKEVLAMRKEQRKKQHREICIRCAKPRVLGKRGGGKGKCSKCWKKEKGGQRHAN